MAYGRDVDELMRSGDKSVEQVVADDNAGKVKRPIEGNNGESKAERKAHEAEEKKLKDLEVKSK